MRLISTYIETENFDASINFYKSILRVDPIIFCENRWVEFDVGNKISLYNNKFDEDKIKENKDIYNNYNEEYINDFNTKNGGRKNNIVTFNFYTDDLKGEYERIKNLNLGEVSDIM